MDERAFEQRVLELEPRLYRTACAILWNDADAADALQECLLKAWRKRGSLKEEACFNSWITRILWGCAMHCGQCPSICVCRCCCIIWRDTPCRRWRICCTYP